MTRVERGSGKGLEASGTHTQQPAVRTATVLPLDTAARTVAAGIHGIMGVGVGERVRRMILLPERFTGATPRQRSHLMLVAHESVERLACGELRKRLVGITATHQVVGVIKQDDPFGDGINDA